MKTGESLPGIGFDDDSLDMIIKQKKSKTKNTYNKLYNFYPKVIINKGRSN